jgi:hypothetical protein
MTTVSTLGTYGDLSGSPLTFRNKIINGNFNIWQRGTSFSSVASYTYTADRWLADGAVTSVTRSGSQNNVLTVVTGAGTGIAQRVETLGGNFYAGQTYTISALVNCTNADLTITVTYRDSNTFKATIHSANVSSQVTAGQYVRVSTTFVLANAPTDFANTNCIQVSFTSAAANTINFQNVQMEAGPVATPFEQRPIGMELALCQRYYYKQAYGTTCAVSIAYWASQTQAVTSVVFPVSMRATPSASPDFSTLTVRHPTSTNGTVSAITLTGSNTSALLSCILSGAGAITAGLSGELAGNTGTSYIAYSAEL